MLLDVNDKFYNRKIYLGYYYEYYLKENYIVIRENLSPFENVYAAFVSDVLRMCVM